MGVSQGLYSLPTEIIHLIASYLEYEYELYALSPVNPMHSSGRRSMGLSQQLSMP
jgi:hypothetical protein